MRPGLLLCGPAVRVKQVLPQPQQGGRDAFFAIEREAKERGRTVGPLGPREKEEGEEAEEKEAIPPTFSRSLDKGLQ